MGDKRLHALDGAISGVLTGMTSPDFWTSDSIENDAMVNAVQFAAIHAATETVLHKSSWLAKVGASAIVAGVVNGTLHSQNVKKVYDKTLKDNKGLQNMGPGARGFVVGMAEGAIGAGGAMLVRKVRKMATQ